ncbi:hypothetical protein NIES4102_26680 [Chondrocystis sp. NIES-4102]|nr:hypothetical protein NIES4102_26680 [Chondrocystis sp. NIES-4102]
MNFKNLLLSILSVLILSINVLIVPQAIASDLISHAPVEAQAYIIEPTDGAIVPETFTVKFGLSGMDLVPAGIEQENSGHHHLLIDQSQLPDLTSSLPSTEQIRHFGKAQTETELTLPKGEHTLQLVLGNYLHIPHDNPVISDRITITVK